ncbi:serine/threonine-protein phosphatase 2A 56 kDa regulatory subunit beta isoform [Mobula birostris]|uniref:serine/threonine-protein phosphatase 2A 56 kDa regulatory subunit beta isoform n=1 Tax=Mobula birostris TaxID=1983395 RepID=UPI003B28089F
MEPKVTSPVTAAEKVDGFSRKSVRRARQRRSHGSSQFRYQSSQVELTPLPLLKDAPVSELHDLFCKKLQQCCTIFDFMDCVADLKGKEIKRAALNELVECIATGRGLLIEPIYPEIMKMVSESRGFFPTPPFCLCREIKKEREREELWRRLDDLQLRKMKALEDLDELHNGQSVHCPD